MYTNDDNVINMVEHLDPKYYDVITIKGKSDNAKPKTRLFMRGATSLKSDQEQSQFYVNAITQSYAKIVLKGPSFYS